MKHDFDVLTSFCKNCGCAEMHAFERREERCPDLTNVVAISHIVRRRHLLSKIVDPVIDRLQGGIE